MGHAHHSFLPDSDEVAYPLVFLVQGMVLFKDNLAQWSEVRKSGVHNINSLLPYLFFWIAQ
jgi:hypothetical protein